MDVDSLSSPYYFVLTNELEATNVFIPKKTLPDLTKAYFGNVKSILYR